MPLYEIALSLDFFHWIFLLFENLMLRLDTSERALILYGSLRFGVTDALSARHLTGPGASIQYRLHHLQFAMVRVQWYMNRCTTIYEKHMVLYAMADWHGKIGIKRLQCIE